MNNPFLKRRRKEAIKVLIAQIVILVLFVGLWELLSSLEIIDAFLFSKPSRIVKLLKTYIVTKTIYKHIGNHIKIKYFNFNKLPTTLASPVSVLVKAKDIKVTEIKLL